MYYALRDALAVEVSELLQQVYIVEIDAALMAGGNGVLLGGARSTIEASSRAGGTCVLIGHVILLGETIVGCRPRAPTPSESTSVMMSPGYTPTSRKAISQRKLI